MSDDRIIDALRRRPSDEPAFDRSLRLPAGAGEGSEPLSGLLPSLGVRRGDGRRPEIRSRTPIRALPALALALALIGVVAVLAFQGGGNEAAPASPEVGTPAHRPSEVPSGAMATASQTALRSGGIPVLPPNITPSAAPTALLYTVKKSDPNLTMIAARYNTTVAAIVAYNQLMPAQYQIQNPNVIWSGRQFYIPPPGWTPGPPTASATAARSN